MRAMMPIAAMPKNATRQPNCCPMSVPIGTPVTVAMVRPVNMMEMALARLFGGTRSAAMVDPMDMKTPCAKADMMRAMSNSVIVVENAAAKLPSMNTIMMVSSKVLRFMRDVSAVKIGAPNMTPTAYSETVSPAVLTGIAKSSAMSGNNPTLINSVVPIAKALTAKANNAKIFRFPFKVKPS